MKLNHALITILLVTFATIMNLSHAQQANTLYFMKGVPQVYQLNPAHQPDYNFFLGIPGLAPLDVRLENSPFALSDVLMYEESIDSLITFLHPLADTDAFLSLLRDKNRISTDVGTSLASMGFRLKKTFLSFDISQRASARIEYPDDLLKLPVYGMDSTMNYDFNNLGIHASLWSEFAFGISRKFGDFMTIGWRGKLLYGQFNINTHKFDVTFNPTENSWPIHSAIKMDVCAPFLNVTYDDEGMIDFENLETRELNFPDDIRTVFLNKNNFGMAMDIGVELKPLRWLQVSASLVDLGRIKWNESVYNLENNGDYEFTGVEVDLEKEDFFEAISDSLEQVFKFSATENPYHTALPAKLFIGAAIYPHPRVSFGALSRTEILAGDVRQQFTLSANFYPIRLLSASFSYSIIDGNYKNLGAGLSFKPGPLNLYLITDTGPSSAFWPYEARFLNLRLGLNLVFGGKKYYKSQKKDKNNIVPMVD